MKKYLALILSLVLVLSLFSGVGTAALAADEAAADKLPLEGYKIGGVDMTATGMTTFLTADITLRDLCKTVGAEFVPVTLAGYDDASFIAAYENLIDQGCDAVIVYTFSEGPLSLIADMLEDAGVDWFLANRRISDEALKEKVFAMDTFIGNCYCEEEENAYNMVIELNQKLGVENLAVIGLAQGDLNGDLRDKGITRACEETGVKLLTETRGINTVDDVTNAVEGIIASYPEVDGIFIVGGVITTGALAGAAQALSNHGLSDKVTIAMVDISAGMSEYMGEGQPLRLVTGGNLVMDNILAGIGIVNHALGVNTEDEPYIVNTHMMSIRTPEDAADYDEYCENPNSPVISGEEWAETLVGKPLADIVAFTSDFSIEFAKGLHS